MEDNFKDFFRETQKTVKQYFEKRLELIKLQTTLKTAQATGAFFSILMVFFILLFIVIFLGMSLSFWLADRLDSFVLGFSITAGIFTILLLLVYIFRKNLVQRPVANMMVKELGRDGE